MLKLYDTYKHELVPFKSIKKGKVGLYTCGPTVYNYITIGNIRAYLFEDILRRSLEYIGYKVTQVMNITDVGHLTMTDLQKEKAKARGENLEITDTEDGLDRMEKAAKREGVSVWDIAQKYIEKTYGKEWDKSDKYYFESDFGKMNLEKPNFLTRATDHVQEQIDFIKLLEKKGFTYTTKKAVYFDISKFTRYEKIVEQKFDDMRKCDRTDSSDPDRKHPADFRLWQLNQPEHAMQWESPWGKGYPGWHIECSTMSRKYLGQPIDIHTGGEDHIKVHHPAEMAQSESAYNKPLANYWLHNEFITVDGKRMGKSLGNAYTLDDVVAKGFDPMDLRLFYLQSHYRSKYNFTWEGLSKAQCVRNSIVKELKRIYNSKAGILNSDMKNKFTRALEDDLNTCCALSVVWEVLKSKINNEDKLATILDFDKVLGLRLKEGLDKLMKTDKGMRDKVKVKVEGLINERNLARSNKEWSRADQIRKELEEKYKVKLDDTKEGTRWEITNLS